MAFFWFSGDVESDLHHSTLLFTYFPLFSITCLTVMFSNVFCCHRLSLCVEVPSCSWFMIFLTRRPISLCTKDSGVDADFCYFLVERDFHTGQALRRWRHQVCEGRMEVLFGAKWRFTCEHHWSHHEQHLQIETTAFHTNHESNIAAKN